MARFYPNQPSGNLPAEQAKLFTLLRRIPGDALKVWLPTPGYAHPDQPHFLILHERGGATLVMVSPLTESAAEATLQQHLFTTVPALRPEEVAAAETAQLVRFGARLPVDPKDRPLPLRQIIAFPHLPQPLLNRIAALARPPLLWLGKESLRSEALAERLSQPEARSLTRLEQDQLRAAYTPEISIPPKLVVSARKGERHLGATFDGYLLDLHQEWLAKEALSEEAAQTVGEPRVRLVTGVAGSGKTLVLLYRALFQLQANPALRTLILTHNRPLRGALQTRCETLMPREAKVDCQTFFGWCYALAGQTQKPIIKPWEREELLQTLIAELPRLASFPFAFLSSEIDWIRDQGLTHRAEYLQAARAGRKRGLTEEQRSAVFDLLCRYQEALLERKETDWSGAAYALERLAEAGTLHLPRYDQVFVDEAQFFAPVWFRLIRRSIAEEQGRLFLAADPTQGFLQRRQSWLGIGIDIRGQATRLFRSYRNTRAILEAATRFYQWRLPDDDEEINLPEPAELALLPPGKPPLLLWMDSAQSERQRITHEILAAIERGARPDQFLVLLAQTPEVEPFVATFNRTAGRPLAFDLHDNRTKGREGVKVSVLNAATGLESPVVFLCGADFLFENEGDIRLAEDEREELFRDNTRRLYMGMTRAGLRLVLAIRREETLTALVKIGFQQSPNQPA